MTDDVYERVEQYIENHPDTDKWDVLGQLGLAPDLVELVEDILEDNTSDEPDTAIPTETQDDWINHNETCANPHCYEPRLYDHPASLCERHLPGEPERNEQTDFDDLDGDDVDVDVDERTDSSTSELDTHRELHAEAQAIVAAESVEDVDVVDPERFVINDAEPTAAAFMGGDSPFANTDTEPDPTPTSSTSDANYARPVSTLPLGQLDALEPADRRRAAKKRGLSWPTTDDAREQLFETIATVMREADDRIVDAPTSLGKSYTIAATRWGARDDITGERPVIHLSQTRDARDEAIEAAREDGGEYFVLRSRDEACPVAAGDHDPDPEETDDDRVVITIDGEPASEWIHEMCDGRGLPFSVVHRHLEEHNDQGVELPCKADGECPAIEQWDEWREGDHPLVLATHNFAHVPGLRAHNNIVIDEEPDFIAELSTDRVRRAVGAYLREIGATVQTWEAFIQMADYEGWGDDAAAERDALETDLNQAPDREWYFEDPDAHTLAPALARAIFHAEPRENGRRVGKTPFEPPRLDAHARDDDDGWNREWVTVVLDDANDVQTVRTVPDFSQARSVIGLDAHPARPVWQANTLPWIQSVDVLKSEQRQLWRRYERGLRVVQVGDATRPLASGEYFDHDGTRAVVEHLNETYGHRFRTALTAKSVEGTLEGIMHDAGVPDPALMHFGEEKSRNDFANERIGLVNGCIDPGDDHVVNLLAELDLDAEPERSETECDHCDGDGCHKCDGTGHKRAHGREFVGEDAEAAAEILSAVRENHTAQAAGRYARNPDDPSSTATVFVRTDAIPPGFADVQVSGAEWVFTTKQQRVVEELRELDRPATALELADLADVSKRHAQRVLKRLAERDAVQAFDRAGPNGATLYADDGTPNTGVVDLTNEDGEVATDLVWGSYTWAVSIQDVCVDETRPTAGRTGADADRGGIFNWVDPPDDG